MKKPNINKITMKSLSILLVFIFFLNFIVSPTYIHAKEKFEGIEIKQKLMVMKEGDKYELYPLGYVTMSFNGRKTRSYDDVNGVKWKSSDEKIATISSKGVITAKKSGRCIIKATYGKMTAECKVRVYTERQLYDHVLDADLMHNDILMDLTNDYFKDYELLKDFYTNEEKTFLKIKAEKKVKEIIKTVVKDDMNDLEKIMSIAKWLVENIKLDNGYISGSMDHWFSVTEKEYYLLPPLLDGISTERGFAYVYGLLLNYIGIRCEYMQGYLEFNKLSDEDDTTVFDAVVIELDGDFYYFDVVGLASSYEFYSSEDQRKRTFYDLIDPLHDEFYDVTTIINRDELYERGRSIRETNYDKLGGDLNYYRTIGNNSKYEVYYYDFYEDKIKFFTKKESSNKNLYPEPVFSTVPIYPDSTSSKYKIPMKVQAELMGRMGKLYNQILDVSYGEADYDTYSILYDIPGMEGRLTALQSDFESSKNQIIDREAIKYMEKKLVEIKKAYQEMPKK